MSKHRDDTAVPITNKVVLLTAYDLLGDGQGSEWHNNTEYTRAVVDLVSDLIGLPVETVDPGGEGRLPFVLGMIHSAHLVNQD